MARPNMSAAGGIASIAYVMRKGRGVGLLRLWKRMRSRNACKTCALGMGGAKGGMVNEAGRFPEFCKKSVQAQAGDMLGTIPEDFFRSTALERMAWLGSRELEELGRLAFPILAEPGDTHFRRVSWEVALERAAEAFRAAKPERTFVYASGRSSNEAAFLLQLVARAYGTPHVHNCSTYCHNASGVALNLVYGSGTSSITLEDLTRTDLAIVIGANPASNHPRLITQLVELRRRGGKVIVINPLKELGLQRFRIPSRPLSLLFGSTVSDLYLQPHLGGDVALLKALLKGVVERKGVDEAFVGLHTVGWEAVLADVRAASWEELERLSGVSRTGIDTALEMLLEARRGIVLWAMGLTHHLNGVDNVLALANLVLAMGWLGREGCGMLPIRGHSNVQGVGSVGVSPVLKAAFARKLEEMYGIPPMPPGQDTFASMLAAERGEVEACLQLGGNLFASNPDRAWAERALRSIPFTVSVTTKLNEGHVRGRGQAMLVLPCLARDEESQATTQESMFNYVRISEGGEPNVKGELRSEVEILAALAERILPPGRFAWDSLRSHKDLRAAIARVVPGFEPLAQIDTAKGEFQIPGRTFHTPAFATPDGKARFHVTAVPPDPRGEGEFLLMTLRSEGQFNTVVYEDEDVYRGIRHRDAVLMAEEDAARLGLAEGDRVRVESEAGHLVGRIATAEIRPGNLGMYYPEANALVPASVDPRSKTPAFKRVVVRLQRWG